MSEQQKIEVPCGAVEIPAPGWKFCDECSSIGEDRHATLMLDLEYGSESLWLGLCRNHFLALVDILKSVAAGLQEVEGRDE